MKVKKPKTTRELKKEVCKVFSIYIRLRDCLLTTGSPEWGECITCSNPPQHRFGDLDAGHFIPGRHNANLFSEEGCHAQCRRCNRFLHGNPLEYRRQIIKLYGNGYDEILERKAQQRKDFSRDELIELKEHYRQKIKELEGK